MPGYRTRTVIGACVVIAAACARQPESDAQDSEARGTTSAPTAAAPAATAPPASATPPGVRLTIARHPDLGAFLGDATGRALYMLEEDPAGESTCYEMCAAIWPPLMAGQGTPTAGDSGVREERIGAVQRRGAGAQVAYNRRPLYYYNGGRAAWRDERAARGGLVGRMVPDEPDWTARRGSRG